MNWKELIERIMDDYRVSSVEIEEMSGVSNAIVSQLRTGKTKKPNGRTIKKLETGLNIRIIKGDGGRLSYVKVGDPDARSKSVADMNELTADRSLELPLISSLPEGSLEEAGKTDMTVTLRIDRRRQFVIKADVRMSKELVPFMKPGDVAVVDMLMRPENDDFVFAKWPGEDGIFMMLSDVENEPEKIMLRGLNYMSIPIIRRREETEIYKVVLVKKEN